MTNLKIIRDADKARSIHAHIICKSKPGLLYVYNYTQDKNNPLQSYLNTNSKAYI